MNNIFSLEASPSVSFTEIGHSRKPVLHNEAGPRE